MTDDPLDAMKARWSYIQGFLFPWMREDNDPITEALGRVVTTLDVIGLEAFVPEPPRGPGRPPEDRRALARAFVAKAVLGVPTTSALIERLDVDKSLRRILGWERRSQVVKCHLMFGIVALAVDQIIRVVNYRTALTQPGSPRTAQEKSTSLRPFCKKLIYVRFLPSIRGDDELGHDDVTSEYTFRVL